MLPDVLAVLHEVGIVKVRAAIAEVEVVIDIDLVEDIVGVVVGGIIGDDGFGFRFLT